MNKWMLYGQSIEFSKSIRISSNSSCLLLKIIFSFFFSFLILFYDHKIRIKLFTHKANTSQWAVFCLTLHTGTSPCFCPMLSPFSQWSPMSSRLGSQCRFGRMGLLWGKTKTLRPMLWPLVALGGDHAAEKSRPHKDGWEQQGNSYIPNCLL